MGAARITIGGVDVGSRSSGVSGSTQRDVEGQASTRVDRTFSRSNVGDVAVSLTLEPTPWSTCPLPPGPWRIVGAVAGAVALGGLMLSLIICLIRQRAHSSRELRETG